MRVAEIWRKRIPLTIAALGTLCIILIHSHINTSSNKTGQGIHNNNNNIFITTTTTTTTPTPPHYLLSKTKNTSITIEKYDALKVHEQIMKMKLSKISDRTRQNHITITRHLQSEDLHLFYNEYLRLRANSSNPNEIVMSNLQLAQAAGAAVLVVKCSRLPPANHPTHSIFRLLFLLAPSYNIKITIAIREYMKRNVMSVRRDIRIFLSTYGKEKALYKATGLDDIEKPVIYVMDSFSISANEWAEILAPNRQSTIRNTPIDCLVLGQLQHEEHSSHLRRSQFDGFFTGCYPNGETFGSTWKNWQSLSIWAKTHSLIWSASIADIDGGPPALGAGLRTTLRSQPRPRFVSICKLSQASEYAHEIQIWLSSWTKGVS